MRLIHVRALALLIALLGAAGCAPDAWRPDPGYNAFLNSVQGACPYLRIGQANSDALFADARFLDDTSRLYHGQITADNWKSSMQGLYAADPDDRGMACVLSKLPATPPPAPGLPVGIKPIADSPSPAPTPGGPYLPPPPGN